MTYDRLRNIRDPEDDRRLNALLKARDALTCEQLAMVEDIAFDPDERELTPRQALAVERLWKRHCERRPRPTLATSPTTTAGPIDVEAEDLPF